MLCADPEWTHVGVITADIRRDWFFFDTRMSLERLDIFLEFYPARPAPRLGRINMAELELLMYPAGHRTFPRTAVYSKSGQCLVFTHSLNAEEFPRTAVYSNSDQLIGSTQALCTLVAKGHPPARQPVLTQAGVLYLSGPCVFLVANALPCTAAYTEKGLHLASTQSLLAVSAGV